MNAQSLIETAHAMILDGKDLLAIDERTGTCNRRFERNLALANAWVATE